MSDQINMVELTPVFMVFMELLQDPEYELNVTGEGVLQSNWDSKPCTGCLHVVLPEAIVPLETEAMKLSMDEGNRIYQSS